MLIRKYVKLIACCAFALLSGCSNPLYFGQGLIYNYSTNVPDAVAKSIGCVPQGQVQVVRTLRQEVLQGGVFVGFTSMCPSQNNSSISDVITGFSFVHKEPYGWIGLSSSVYNAPSAASSLVDIGYIQELNIKVIYGLTGNNTIGAVEVLLADGTLKREVPHNQFFFVTVPASVEVCQVRFITQSNRIAMSKNVNPLNSSCQLQAP